MHTILSSPAHDEDIRDLLFADHTVVLSRYYEKKLRDLGLDAISVIPPGIPVARSIEDSEKSKIRENFRFDPRPIVLFAGDYQFSNAAWTILEAIPDVIRETKAQFVYACRIKQPKSREIESAIKYRAIHYGLENDVRFYNDLENLRELLAISAISIMPADSLYAKMDIPLVLLECLSERVPIIVADIDPLREIVQDDYGVLVPPSHPAKLSRAIVEMLLDPQKRRRMGETGRSYVEHEFDVRLMARRYEQLYSELLRKR